MRLTRAIHTWYVSSLVLKASAVFVPRAGRAEWLAEWQGELWHVGRVCGADPHSRVHGQRQITAFCAGALQDALVLRLQGGRRRWAAWFEPGTVSRCMLLLAGLFAATLLCALCLPRVRGAMWAAPSGPTDSLVLVSQERYLGEAVPTIQFEEYRAWKANPFAFARKLIFYRPATRVVRFSHAHTARLSVGYASDSLLQVLGSTLDAGLPLSMAGTTTMPRVFLSREVWRRDYNASSDVIGRTIDVAGHRAVVAGVAGGESWPIPGNMDVVLLESDAALASFSPDAPGFMLAPDIGPLLYRDDPSHAYILARRASGGVIRYECATLSQRRTRPWMLFLFTLLLACFALPATTPLPLGDFPLRDSSDAAGSGLRRWAFLSAKLLFVTSVVCCLSASVAYAGMAEGSSRAQYTQLLLAFFGLLFALRWTIRDQRSRCPRCLRILTRPAHVGHPSHIFLAWHGTEMLCASGHGLLYIPEHPTSWCSTQRWQPLDASWASLFPV